MASTSVTIRSYSKERLLEIMQRLKSGMDKAVLIVENQAKLNVTQSPPKHPRVGETGRLRSSITSRVMESGNEIEGEIGTNVYYGKYLELGTSHHPPYPWLFPAVESNRSRIKDALKGDGFEVR